MVIPGKVRAVLAGLLVLTLAACTGTEQTLQPIPDNGVILPGSTTGPTATQGPSPTTIAPSGTTADTQIRGQIRFTPVIGAPVAAVTPLSRELAAQSRQLGLKILSASDPGGDHVMKGYFSADSFEGNVTVFFVWDVLDAAGNRLHRIQGQEATAQPGGTDVWASVPPSVMETIARRTMSEYAAWRGL